MNIAYPSYQSKCADWDRLMLAFKGGAAYVQQNLKQHLREADEIYQLRLDLAYYLNYCRQFINTIISYIFSRKDQIHIVLPKRMQRLHSNADRKNTSLYNLMKKLLGYALIYGQHGVLIDSPHYMQRPNTKLEQDLMGLDYYLVPIRPHQVKRWQIDRDTGLFEWVTIYEQYDYIPSPFADATKIKKTKVFYRDRIEIFDQTQNQDLNRAPNEVILHQFGQVPFFWIMPMDVDEDGFGESAIQDIAPINRVIMNLCSLIDEQAFSILFPQWMIPDTAMDTKDSVTGLPKRLELGITKPLFYTPDENSSKPELITASSDPIAALQTWIETLRLEMIRIIGLNTPGKLEQNTASGIAKTLDFIDSNNTLSSIASSFGDQMTEPLKCMARALQQNDDDIIVGFPSDFNVTQLRQFIQEILEARDNVPSETFHKKTNEIMARKALSNYATEDEMMRIIDEIWKDETPATFSNQPLEPPEAL